MMQELIEKEADKVRFLFNDIQVNKPLLWSADDCQQLADILVSHIAAKKNEQVVLVGHGTPGPANAMYTMLDYALQDKGHSNYHVATIEGYPSLESVMKLLKQKKAKRVILSQKEGYQVTVLTEGLGEMQEVQEWIVEKGRSFSK